MNLILIFINDIDKKICVGMLKTINKSDIPDLIEVSE